MRIPQRLFTRIAALFGVMLVSQCCCCIIPLPASAQAGVFDSLIQAQPWVADLAAAFFLP